MSVLLTILSWLGLAAVCAAAFGLMCKLIDEEERQQEADEQGRSHDD